MPKFRVWDAHAETEYSCLRRDDKWATLKAHDAEHAATQFADSVTDADMETESFGLHVRNLRTGVLYIVELFWEWSPSAAVLDSREVPPVDDLFRANANQMLDTVTEAQGPWGSCGN